MRFSVIIPTRDRPEQLADCLAAIGRQTFAAEQFELIVIDDGSTPPVDESIGRHTGSIALRLLRQENRGPAAARNLGLRTAIGEYAVFTDDDCVPAPDWLAGYERAFRTCPDCGWGGEIEPAPGNGIFGDASQLLVSYLYASGDEQARFFCTNNLAFRRDLLESIGGFDETFPLAAAEDRDLCYRWLRRHSLRPAAGAMVHHRQLLTFPGFVSQQFRYGRGAYQYQTRRADTGQPGVRIGTARFYREMLRFPWRVHAPNIAWLHSGLLAIAQAAIAAGYFRERFQRG